MRSTSSTAYDGDVERLTGADGPARESLSGTRVPRIALPRFGHRDELVSLAAAREPAGPVPVHRRRVHDEARRRRPDPHVRGRRRTRADEPPLPPARRRAAGDATVDRVRFRHPLRRRSRRAARHLRQGGHVGRVDRDARRHEGALRRVRPDRSVDVGFDDDQRTGPRDPGHVPEHCDRPAPRARSRRGSAARSRHRAGRHPQRGPGPEHVHPLHRLRVADDGRHPGVVHRARGPPLLQRFDLRIPHRGSRREPDQPARVHARQRIHLRRGLPGARHGDRRLRTEPVVLLLQRARSRVHRSRSSRAPHLGDRAARPVRRRRTQSAAEVPHPDVGPVAARAGDRIQRHPHDAAGPVRDLRQRQLAPHQRVRRGDHDPDRRVGSPCDGDPTHHQSRVGPRAERQSAAGCLHRRGAHGARRRGGPDANSIASAIAAACSARWRPATSGVASRTSRCCTSSASTTAPCRSSA